MDISVLLNRLDVSFYETLYHSVLTKRSRRVASDYIINLGTLISSNIP